ncbi:MAG: hypothetical protein ACRENO_06005 [Thermodesulfobacteriota bacterium]
MKNIYASKLIIGEERTKLISLLNSIFESDLIILGTQQSMIPKFIALYFDIRIMPIVVILYREIVPDYPFFSSEEINKKFIFVDLNDPNYD